MNNCAVTKGIQWIISELSLTPVGAENAIDIIRADAGVGHQSSYGAARH
ncbi:MAG: hypothetical protein ABI621_11970 [Chloroflexota bacterium]